MLSSGYPGFHLFVGNHPAFRNIGFRFTDCGEERNFIGDIPVVNIIRKPLDRLQNLLLDAHG